MRPDDALKYAYARAKATTEWTCDAISGSLCGHGHDDELNAIGDLVESMHDLVQQFGDPNRYSDGRLVKSSAVIDEESGLYTSHVWHPVVLSEEPRSWRGALCSGYPDVPSPGVYEVSTDPVKQEIYTRVIRVAGGSA